MSTVLYGVPSCRECRRRLQHFFFYFVCLFRSFPVGHLRIISGRLLCLNRLRCAHISQIQQQIHIRSDERTGTRPNTMSTKIHWKNVIFELADCVAGAEREKSGTLERKYRRRRSSHYILLLHIPGEKICPYQKKKKKMKLKMTWKRRALFFVAAFSVLHCDVFARFCSQFTRCSHSLRLPFIVFHIYLDQTHALLFTGGPHVVAACCHTVLVCTTDAVPQNH